MSDYKVSHPTLHPSIPGIGTPGTHQQIHPSGTQTALENAPDSSSILPSDSLSSGTADGSLPDLVCLSHLRWDFVYQRPQHLMSRFARQRRVFFFEEPLWYDGAPFLQESPREDGLVVVVPMLPHGTDAESAQESLLNAFLEQHRIQDFVLWYYTPMAMGFSRHLEPVAVVYDCMDELSLFKGAPPVLQEREKELLERANLVFTGGASLYEYKRNHHPHVHCFPSSIDRAHFARARTAATEPADQASLPHPRLGFFGVVDERFDIGLLAAVAEQRPDWQFVIVGPVVKIDPGILPRRDNIHYLGSAPYHELPAYLAGWDVALLLFARNDATRFISPTKTPEYLAGGKPVVSTSIRDVVNPYGTNGFVEIADTPEAFIASAERLLGRSEAETGSWLERVDAFLATASWDNTWSRMDGLIREQVAQTPGNGKQRP